MKEIFVSYLDFELDIGLGRGREYPVAVTHSPAGEAQTTMRFPFDESGLEKRLVVLQNALLDSGGGDRRFPSPEELVVRNFGRDLFEALFTGEVRHCYEQSLEQAWGEDKGLRLKLRFHPPDLASLPWEFLYDPRQTEYICLSHNTPLVRYLETPQTIPPLNLSPPLRIVGVIASSADLKPFEVAREKERVETALQGLQVRGLAKLTWLEDQTWRHVQRVVERGAWHVFHFIGQSDSSRRDPRRDRPSDEGFTAPVAEEGDTHRLSAPDLVRLLADHPSLRVTLLNARQGDRGASLRNTFTSTAALLVRQGIPAVLSIPYEITDEAAIELFRAFYEGLALGAPVDAAVAEARKAVSSAVDNTVEWGAPALFVGSPDGLVFSPPGEFLSVEAQVVEEPRLVPVQLETPAEVLGPERETPVPTPQPCEPELVLIPAGEFLMGSDPQKDQRAYEAEQPQHRVYLPDYHISRTPITNAQYAAFVEAGGYPAPNRWEDGKSPVGQEDYPVVYISWRDAMAYCRWLSEKNGQAYRLPSEAEWEKAARGTDGWIYPWGNEWDPSRCNSKESGPDDATPVDAYPDGASPYGILDMAGNMWEWTGSLYRPYPYDPMDGREDPTRAGDKRVLRGGAFYSTARRVRCAYRDSSHPDDWRGHYGFRVCVASRQD